MFKQKSIKNFKKYFLALICALFSALIFTQNYLAFASDYFVSFEIKRDYFYIENEKISHENYLSLKSEVKTLVNSIEDKISVELHSSDIYKINRAIENEIVTVSDYTFELLTLCKEYFTTTYGKFSPALYNLTKLWGFSPDNSENYSVSRAEPSEQEITNAKTNSDFNDLILLENNGVKKLNSALQIDLGGVAKGYICDKVEQLIKANYDGKNLDALITIMSNSVILGSFHDGENTRGWRVSIDNPRAQINSCQTAYQATDVINTAITTSSDEYRVYKYNGKIYSHIIDSFTGKPADKGIISVSVFIDDDTQFSSSKADIFSTAGFCMNLTDAIDFYKNNNVKAIILTNDYKYYVVGEIAVKSLNELDPALNNLFEKAELSEAVNGFSPCQKELEYIGGNESASVIEYIIIGTVILLAVGLVAYFIIKK